MSDNAGSDFQAEELDSIVNVIGLNPNDPLNGFGEMWYQVFLWALFSSMVVHAVAALIALCRLRKHSIGRWIPLGIFIMGVLSPLTAGVVTSAAVAGCYRASDFEMAPFYALLWGLGQTVVCGDRLLLLMKLFWFILSVSDSAVTEWHNVVVQRSQLGCETP